MPPPSSVAKAGICFVFPIFFRFERHRFNRWLQRRGKTWPGELDTIDVLYLTATRVAGGVDAYVCLLSCRRRGRLRSGCRRLAEERVIEALLSAELTSCTWRVNREDSLFSRVKYFVRTAPLLDGYDETASNGLFLFMTYYLLLLTGPSCLRCGRCSCTNGDQCVYPREPLSLKKSDRWL